MAKSIDFDNLGQENWRTIFGAYGAFMAALVVGPPVLMLVLTWMFLKAVWHKASGHPVPARSRGPAIRIEETDSQGA